MFRLKIPEILLKKPLKMSEVAPDHGTSREGNKRGGSLTVFPKFSRPSWTKMSEISINTVENIAEVEQIILLTTCTTKLHSYYRVTLHFFLCSQKNFSRNSKPPFYYHHPFITFARVSRRTIIRENYSSWHHAIISYLSYLLCRKIETFLISWA